jgi:DNA polymerase III subunit alpha
VSKPIHKPDDFVHIHLHSEFSALDGMGRVAEYVQTAKERGNPAIGLSDHGTCRGFMHLQEATKKAEIKPIYGEEFYVSQNMRRKGLTAQEKAEITKGLKPADGKKAIKDYEEKHGIRDRWHLGVYAMNQEGLRNLYRLSSASYIDGFYYKPRIDLDELIKYQEGLMITTGCMSSPINDSLLQGRRRDARAMFEKMSEAFDERLWLEIQPHAIRDQRTANEYILKLREEFGKKHRLLATQDAHYLKREDAQHHEVLLCIGTNDVLSNQDRFKFDGDEFHMRNRKAMWKAFQKHHEHIPSQRVKEALNSTLEFAEMCTAEIKTDYHATLLPDPGIPKKYDGDSFAYLQKLCLDGWAWRGIRRRAAAYAVAQGITEKAAYQVYVDRMKRELLQLKKQRFVDYFLMIYDVYRFARKAGIQTGPGRGSSGGSLVMYLIGCTAVDPIEHDLMFERFVAPWRVDMPDADMDFEDKRRGEIIEHLINKYGRDRVCQMATFGKLGGKQCLKDISRVLEIPLKEVNAITSSIVERSSGDERASATIEDSFQQFDVCRQFNERHPKVLHHAKRMEGLVKQLGIHAAGVIASPVPLTDLIPLETRTRPGGGDEGRIIVSAFEMYGVAANGLVKMDVLGLRTLTVIRECLEAIKRRHGKTIDLESDDVDLKDKRVLDGFTKHDYSGVFQYDTPSANKICAGIVFENFNDVAALVALNRPGTARSGLAGEFVRRKQDPKLAKKVHFHPKVSEITKDTLGILVYQEHVIKIFTEVAGFAPATADALRKVIAKKIGDETIGKERKNFVEGAMKHTPGMTEKVANKIIDAITFFGSYGFNKSHSVEYGLIAYWTMFLKVYYPLEFYYALMKNEPDHIKIQKLAKDAKQHGLKVLPPHVSTSKSDFVIDDKEEAIRGSLSDIKHCGDNAADAIMKAQPFKDIFDFYDRIERRKVHSGVVTALAKAGAMDGLVPNTKWFIDNMKMVWTGLGSTTKRPEIKRLLEASKGEPDYSPEDRALVSASVNPLAFGKHPVDAYRSFLKRQVKIPMPNASDPEFLKKYHRKAALIAGIVVDVEYNQIGDFHSGRAPDEEERKRIFWGLPYANVTIEARGGEQHRVRFDIEIFDEYRPIIDRSVGKVLLIFSTVSDSLGTRAKLGARFAMDLETFRTKVNSATEELTIWEKIVSGEHPSKNVKWKTEQAAAERWDNRHFVGKKRSGVFCGVVCYVKPKYDKRGQLMAFIGLIDGAGNYVEALCFAHIWKEAQGHIKMGRLLKLPLKYEHDKERGGTYFFSGGTIKRLR